VTFLLDTNCCIHLLNDKAGKVHTRFLDHSPRQIKLCSVVKAELFYGARHSQQVQKNIELLARFFEPLECLSFDDRCAEAYGILRELLSRQGKPIGPNDMMIAATALANDLILVTHNTGEFSRVPGLRLEDWEA
jgi:tRNA(fMet)-specific endonuclease VapC